MKEDKYVVDTDTVEGAITQEIYIPGTAKTQMCILILNTGYEAVGYHSFYPETGLSVSVKKAMVRDIAFRKAKTHIEGLACWQKIVADIMEKDNEKDGPVSMEDEIEYKEDKEPVAL